MKMAAAHVSDEVLKALDEIAKDKGVERTKVIRQALNEYIKRNKRRPSERPIDPSEVQQIAA